MAQVQLLFFCVIFTVVTSQAGYKTISPIENALKGLGDETTFVGRNKRTTSIQPNINISSNRNKVNVSKFFKEKLKKPKRLLFKRTELAHQHRGRNSNEQVTKSETTTFGPNRNLNQNVKTSIVMIVPPEAAVQRAVTEAPTDVTKTPRATTFLNKIVTKPSRNNVTITPTKNATAMITSCETPNNDLGLCMDLKTCPLLLNLVNNPDGWTFLRASQCEISRMDKTLKVCCGKYDHFRNVTNSPTGEGDALPKTCGHQKQLFKSRIVGGTEASLGEYPWMALILHEDDHGNKILGCAGFLIHTKYVITAAHCTHPDMITQRGKIVSVLLGSHEMDTNLDCSGSTCVKSIQNIDVIEVTTHPDFNPNGPYFDDIAVVKLIKDAQLTDYVQPICIKANNTQIPTKYYLSGWGKTETAMRSKIKMKIEVPPFDQVDCVEKYSHININLDDAHICAGGEYQKDSCTGDSGGPLMMVSGNETWYAAGIVSFGVGCGMKGWPGVYTNLDKFLPWIKSQMGQK